jgi:hypothetical protein
LTNAGDTPPTRFDFDTKLWYNITIREGNKMAKYKLIGKLVSTYSVEIEADTEDEAIELGSEMLEAELGKEEEVSYWLDNYELLEEVI